MIRILPDAVVDRIAAGEVVERPASVVKELVENALDAGARRIEVKLREGGAGLVRVTDDGSGMSADDALLCLERHATSKIVDVDDLFGVRSMGFRGEALPSIASVSRFELRTRRAADEVGTEVRVEGGRMEHVGPAAAPVGTDVAVRALFFAVPARRKFLRSAQTEVEHCDQAVIRALLRRPDVAIAVQHDGRDRLRSPAGDDPVRRVADLLGDDLRGLLAGDAEDGGIRVRAWVAPPGVTRATPAEATWTFVRGRYVRDPVLRKAIAETLEGGPGRHPFVMVDLDVPDGDVDVNVHPAKVEVRFRAPRDVARVVRDAVVAASGRRLPPPLAASPSPLELIPPPTRPARVEVGPRIPALPPPALAPEAPAFVSPRSDPATHGPLDVGPVAPRPPLDPAPAAQPDPEPLPRPKLALRGVAWTTLVGAHVVGSSNGEVVVADVVRAQVEVETARLRAEAAAGGVRGRPLLAPEVVALGPAERAAVLERAPSWEAWGLAIVAFGPGEVAIVESPVDVGEAPVLLRDLVALGESAGIPQALARSGARPPASLALARGWLAAFDELGLDAERARVARRLDAAALRGLLRG